VERERVSIVLLGRVHGWAIACPERPLERQRVAEVLHDPVPGREAQRATELPVRLPDREREPVDDAVHRMEVDRAPRARFDEAAAER
jgi:hypothetical protein